MSSLASSGLLFNAEKLKKHHKKIRRKSIWRKINDWLHLWLGLISGIVIFIVSITGCLYAFQKEIKDASEPWRFVTEQNIKLAPPSKLLAEAKRQFPDKKPTGLTYGYRNEAAAVGFQSTANGKMEFSVVFMNPYTGKVIRKSTLGKDFDFFRFVMDGHRALWLPYSIGRPIVGVSTIIFLFLILSGLVMWWPKKWKRNHLKQAFTIKFNAKFRRLNYDLHNVLGFYSFVLAGAIAVTGLVISFEWFSNGLYFLSSGGRHRTEIQNPKSRSSQLSALSSESKLDAAWNAVLQKTGDARGGMFMNPEISDKAAPVEITVFNRPGKFYDKTDFFYDQYSLSEIPVKNSDYKTAEFAEKLSMLNYDMHTGQVWGLPGKILAFFISLICASLPITGFIIWLKRKKSAGKKNM